jgi:RNA polymerase primary sigma factor/RNA polymerase nonessential primary-like sigma factor
MSNSKSGSATAGLLSAEDEIELARRIEAGVLAREILSGWSEVRGFDATAVELGLLVRDGELAQRRFVQANLGLVSMVAGQFASRMGYGRTELFQEGCVGLLLAVQRFDHRRGCRFATYALFWIRALIGAASARSRGAADLPARRAEELRGLRGLEGELAQRFGRSATVTELAEAAGRSTDWVAGLVAYEAPQSLEQLGELDLQDPSGADPAETVGVSARPGRELLWHLAALERQILELRMGFSDDRPHSYAEVARMLNLPVARVRRTELRALERLRAVCPAGAAVHL